MEQKVIEFTKIENFISSYLDEKLINGNFSEISNSKVWTDSISENDIDNWCRADVGYRYEIAFFGTNPVGCLSIWDEANQKSLHKNLDIVFDFKYIRF